MFSGMGSAGSLHVRKGIKKVRICRSSMRTFRIQSLIMVSLSRYQGELLSAGINGRSSGSRFILQAPSRSADQWHNALRHRLQRRVRGGIIQSELHPSSLSSPCGHRDPIFNCHKSLIRRYVAEIPRPLYPVKGDVREINVYPSVSATFQAIYPLRLSIKPIKSDNPRVSAPPTIPERALPGLLPSDFFPAGFCSCLTASEAGTTAGVTAVVFLNE